MSTVHVVPVNDLIEHDSDGRDCPCGPTTEPVMRDDGSNGWLIVHHSLPEGLEAVSTLPEVVTPCGTCGRLIPYADAQGRFVRFIDAATGVIGLEVTCDECGPHVEQEPQPDAAPRGTAVIVERKDQPTLDVVAEVQAVLECTQDEAARYVEQWGPNTLALAYGVASVRTRRMLICPSLEPLSDSSRYLHVTLAGTPYVLAPKPGGGYTATRSAD